MLSHPLLEGLLGDDAVQHVLGDAEHAYVTISTKSGPHSTPEVHFAWGGRIWLMVRNETVKAKVLRRRPETGVLAHAGDRAVVVAGQAHIIDSAEPSSSLRSMAETMLSGAAVAGYASRNQQDLLGFVRDALNGEHGTDPASRPVLLAIRPTAVAVTDGTTVLSAEGEWPGERGGDFRGEPGSQDGEPLGQLPALPQEISKVLEDETECVVGWESELAPLGLRGRWDPRRRVATVSTDLFALAGLTGRSQGCITLDAVEAHHPAGKHGAMLRGPATATAARNAVEVRLTPDRVTWWRGSESGTEAVT